MRDELSGAEPWAGAASPASLAARHFKQAAGRLECEPAAIRAVWEVEASGRHFADDGTVLRRFEPHKAPRAMWDALGFRPGAAAPWRASLAIPADHRATMFAVAAEIEIEAACAASSWGAPQIMGFNASDAGFASAEAMVRHMARGAPEQLGAWVQLIEGWGLATTLRAHDWRAFARRYNGSGQVETYARKIEAAYRKHSGGASAVALRVDGAFGPETLAAVEAFQRKAGLPVDGIVGARTWAELERASAIVTVDPPKQQTPTDALIDRVKVMAAVVGSITAAIEGARQAIPEIAWPIMAGAAGACAVIAVAAWAIRYARGAAR